MIIQLQEECSGSQLEVVLKTVGEFGWKATEVRTQKARYLVAIGKQEFDIRSVGSLPGVQDVHRVSDAYKLVSRKWKAAPTTIEISDDVTITSGDCSLILGPCSIESESQIQAIAEHLVAHNVRMMRGGAFKPRTSPYSFRGLGLEGLKMCHEIASKRGIKVVSEVVTTSDIEKMYPYVDVYQVGARNTQNFALLHELGQVDKPVLIKRGISGTIEELLQSAEYVFSNGNEKLLLCERGIRTFEPASRNTLDLNAVPILKEKSHLPVLVDPSHGIGIRRHVQSMALAAVMAGADGLLIEIHEEPERALSDGQQTLNLEESTELISRVRTVHDCREKLGV